MPQTLSDKIIELNEKLNKLELEMKSMSTAYELIIADIRSDFNRVFTEQRAEIVSLRNEMEAERQDGRNRRAKAIAQLKSV